MSHSRHVTNLENCNISLAITKPKINLTDTYCVAKSILDDFENLVTTVLLVEWFIHEKKKRSLHVVLEGLKISTYYYLDIRQPKVNLPDAYWVVKLMLDSFKYHNVVLLEKWFIC